MHNTAELPLFIVSSTAISTIRMRFVAFVAAIAVLGLAAAGGPAKADSLNSPPGVFYGSGNAGTNYDWTVTTVGSYQIGLQGIERFVGPYTPVGNIYDVPLGDTAVAGHTGDNWGVSFSWDTSSATVSLSLTDALTGTTSSFNPDLLPDNAMSAGVSQNSEALTFAAIAAALGDPGYSDAVNDTLTFTLTESIVPACAVGCPDSISDTIEIVQGAGYAPVPESGKSGSLGFLFTGLIGFTFWRWRFRHREQKFDPSAA